MSEREGEELAHPEPPTTHAHTPGCPLWPRASLGFERYILPEFPSLKGYQIGRELARTLTRSFRESSEAEGGGGTGARFLLKWSLGAVSCPLASSLSRGSTPKAELPRALPPPVTPGLPSGLPLRDFLLAAPLGPRTLAARVAQPAGPATRAGGEGRLQLLPAAIFRRPSPPRRGDDPGGGDCAGAHRSPPPGRRARRLALRIPWHFEAPPYPRAPGTRPQV